MEIVTMQAGLLETNLYFVVNNVVGKALLIDAPLDSKELVMDFLNRSGLKLEAILLTHTHWDHSGDCALIKQATGAPIYVHRNDLFRLQNPNEHLLIDLDLEILPADADVLLDGEVQLKFNTTSVRVLPTPGHTEGSVTFVIDELKSAFVGDTIFYLSVGRTDLPGGNEDELFASIQNVIFNLPDDYILYPGHERSTTVYFERLYNPYILK